MAEAEKRKGRPGRKYDPELADKIRELTANGLRQEDIASFIGMSENTMRKLYKSDLVKGATLANSTVGKKLFEQCVKGDTAALIFWAKTRMGWSEKASFIGREILEQFEAGEITLIQAALKFEKSGLSLPETIRILLAKHEPEQEDPSHGQYMVISDEEMEARVAERKAMLQIQINGLPERQAEMRALHDQVADKFKSANT